MKKNDNPYVSIVMTSYNREKYICQAIDSILAQVCNYSYEIIIGDDCSTDTSRELLTYYKNKFPDIFVLNFQDKNQGFGVNWASTCKLARGKYIAFCDDDDYWCDTEHLKLLTEHLDTHDECGLVYANRYVFDVARDTKIVANVKLPTTENALDYMLNKSYPILFSASMLRKSLMDKYVDLDAYIRLRFPIQDFPTAILLAPHCEFHYIEKPTVVYRSYDGSMSKPKDYETVMRKYTQEEIMHRYLYEQLGLVYDELSYRRYKYGILLQLAYQKVDYKSAKEFAKYVDVRNNKKYFAQSWVTFHIFCFLKKIRRKLLFLKK